MGLFSKLFSKADPKTPARVLNHPSQLNVGDMITLDDSFALPAALRGQSLQVTAISTYEYEHSKQFEWALQGSNSLQLFLSIDDDDQPQLVFSLKLTRADVGELFDLDQFSSLFDEPGQAVLDRKTASEAFEQWSATSYRQCEFAQVGYFHRSDYRTQSIGSQQGDAFERYGAISDDERHGIEAEVYQDGETEVMLTLYRPISDIREYWPKG